MAAVGRPTVTTNSQATGTSMNLAVAAGTNALVIVKIVSRSTTDVIATPTRTGITFVQIDPPALAGRAQHRDRMYAAYGTWSAGNIVLGFSVSTVHAAMAIVFPDDSTHPTTPYSYLKYRNTNGDNGAGTGGVDANALDITFSNTDVEQRMLVVASTRVRGLTTSPGDADYTREGAVSTGTGGNDQALTAESRTKSPAGSDTWSSTAANSVAVDWITEAILINPKPVPTSRLKRWNGSAWVVANLKRHNGSIWVPASLKKF